MRELRALAADAYSMELLSFVLGPSYHPGGLDLTGRLASWMRVPRGSRVLDVAAGPGASARYLAEWFGWDVVGVDASPRNVARARRDMNGGTTAFLAGDANRLPFRPGRFDAAVCECSLCLFGDEERALREIAGALRPGARVGLSEITIAEDAVLGPGLQSALAAIACLATAKPLSEYQGAMERAGIRTDRVEDASWALGALLESLREMARRGASAGLSDFRVGDLTVGEIRGLLEEAWVLYQDGGLRYIALVGTVTP